MRSALRQGTSFVLIGLVGFAVDGGVLTLLSTSFAMNLFVARGFSFLLACLATWLLNRSFTFAAAASPRKGAEYGRYLLVQTGGALANLAIFSWLVMASAQMRAVPILPLAIGAMAGLVINFSGARLWVYR